MTEAILRLSVADVDYSVEGGNYEEAKDVVLSTETEGALIYYTTDGSVPSPEKMYYVGPIHVSSDSTVKAIAVKDGYVYSNVNEKEYTFVYPASPVLSLASGIYADGQSLALDCKTSGATIYYTTDGSRPTADSLVYSSELALNRNMIVRAVSIKNGLSSEESYAQYNVKAHPPVSDIRQGTYQNPVTLQLFSSTPDSVIRYTLDGTTPTESSSIYDGSISITNNTVVKAVAFKDGLVSSNTSTFSYVIDNQSSGITITDPEIIDVEIKVPTGWYSGITVDEGTSEYLEAVLSKNVMNASYSWYIDDCFMAVSKNICLASYSDELTPGIHIIRLEVEVNGQLLIENFLLKIE